MSVPQNLHAMLTADVRDWTVERWRKHDTNRFDPEALQLLPLKIINNIIIIYINT